MVWDGLLDYAPNLIGNQLKYKFAKLKLEDHITSILKAFDARWMRRKVIGSRNDRAVRWNFLPC